MKNIITKGFVLSFFFHSCNHSDKLELVDLEKKSEMCILNNGYVVKQFENNLPTGRFIYFDINNRVHKIEWYYKNKEPYYSLEIERLQLKTKIDNYQLIDIAGIRCPEVSAILYEEGIVLIQKYFNPIDKFYCLQGNGLIIENRRVDNFENKVTGFIEGDFENKKELIFTFDYIEKNGVIRKRFDSVKVKIIPAQLLK